MTTTCYPKRNLQICRCGFNSSLCFSSTAIGQFGEKMGSFTLKNKTGKRREVKNHKLLTERFRFEDMSSQSSGNINENQKDRFEDKVFQDYFTEKSST